MNISMVSSAATARRTSSRDALPCAHARAMSMAVRGSLCPERVHVGQLHGVVTVLLDFGHTENDRLSAEVGLQKRIWRVAVRCGHSRVLGHEDLCRAQDLIEWAFILRVRLVHVELVHGFVCGDHWKAIDVGLLTVVFARDSLAHRALLLIAGDSREGS